MRYLALLAVLPASLMFGGCVAEVEDPEPDVIVTDADGDLDPDPAVVVTDGDPDATAIVTEPNVVVVVNSTDPVVQKHPDLNWNEGPDAAGYWVSDDHMDIYLTTFQIADVDLKDHDMANGDGAMMLTIKPEEGKVRPGVYDISDEGEGIGTARIIMIFDDGERLELDGEGTIEVTNLSGGMIIGNYQADAGLTTVSGEFAAPVQ